MGKISKMFDFDNIGGKIKNLAKWYCWITIFLIWITTPIVVVWMLTDDYLFELAWIPVVAAVVCPFLVWISSWTMYAFGELVENVHAMRTNAPAEEEKRMKDEPEFDEEAIQRMQEQLSVEDMEKAVSAYFGRPVSVSEMDCTLIYVIPAATDVPKEMHLYLEVDGQNCSSLDLFFDQKRKGYYIGDRQLALDDTWRSEEDIFGFDVALFRDFDTEVDEDDE